MKPITPFTSLEKERWLKFYLINQVEEEGGGGLLGFTQYRACGGKHERCERFVCLCRVVFFSSFFFWLPGVKLEKLWGLWEDSGAPLESMDCVFTKSERACVSSWPVLSCFRGKPGLLVVYSRICCQYQKSLKRLGFISPMFGCWTYVYSKTKTFPYHQSLPNAVESESALAVYEHKWNFSTKLLLILCHLPLTVIYEPYNVLTVLHFDLCSTTNAYCQHRIV